METLRTRRPVLPITTKNVPMLTTYDISYDLFLFRDLCLQKSYGEV